MTVMTGRYSVPGWEIEGEVIAILEGAELYFSVGTRFIIAFGCTVCSTHHSSADMRPSDYTMLFCLVMLADGIYRPARPVYLTASLCCNKLKRLEHTTKLLPFNMLIRGLRTFAAPLVVFALKS